MAQLHKKFTDFQVKELLERYLKNEVERTYIQQIFGIGKTRFFALVQSYREAPDKFSIQYVRKAKTRQIAPEVEKNILKELSIEKGLIKNKEVPLKAYNYSYIKDQLRQEYRQRVSLGTIINRAKEHGFYLNKPQRTAHDREVLTHYTGELIQHDASYHLWAPRVGYLKVAAAVQSIDLKTRQLIVKEKNEKPLALNFNDAVHVRSGTKSAELSQIHRGDYVAVRYDPRDYQVDRIAIFPTSALGHPRIYG